MQSVHEGTEAMLLPALLAAVPSILAQLLVPSSTPAACILCTVMYSFLPVLPVFFFFFFLTHSHTRLLSKSKRSHLSRLVRWLFFFFLGMSIFSVQSQAHYGSFCHLFCISCCVYIVFAQECTPGCLTMQLQQTSCSYVPLIIRLIWDLLLCCKGFAFCSA